MCYSLFAANLCERANLNSFRFSQARSSLSRSQSHRKQTKNAEAMRSAQALLPDCQKWLYEERSQQFADVFFPRTVFRTFVSLNTWIVSEKPRGQLNSRKQKFYNRKITFFSLSDGAPPRTVCYHFVAMTEGSETLPILSRRRMHSHSHTRKSRWRQSNHPWGETLSQNCFCKKKWKIDGNELFELHSSMAECSGCVNFFFYRKRRHFPKLSCPTSYKIWEFSYILSW